MMTIDQIIEYMEQTIAQDYLAGNKVNLRQTQTAAGILMAAADSVSDMESARRFRLVAAQAANQLEAVERAEQR
ncbi:MAG: hypothetical protein HC876_03030 [Chloroflexaceae bacterium]|nr:hypothetical protein [Chloroflexaceae bacterium]NJO04580.1 hypothetical protein [Chloroflexaceae bacterium]